MGLATLGVAATALMSGCSINRAMRPDSYTVQRGDTLSEIAQHYDIDWHNLARWNHIGPPYRIRVGQQLTLKPYPRLDYARMSGTQPAPLNTGGYNGPPRSAPSSDSDGHVQPLQSPGTPTVTQNPSTGSAAAPDHVTKSSSPSGGGQSATTAQANSQEENSIDHATSSATTRQTTVKAGGPSADGWQWPASGSLLRAYDPSARRRGIEIGGKVGSPIYAASSGTVVYNGSGLKGYGKLIIIKHDQHYLSAYGFVEHSRVKQGQTVQAGAHIADMGLGPENKPMLHFEIRKDGDPINPQKVLPDH
ncbi:peptidoglycan DD-metalloendopeptidase family protein [Salinisphaera hydrothermalis]|uniref:Lipoprotein NlpD n=1 Tax=Salinisphaera hydrothermalis (strain C41B8) TaxID=1304275 RepID=A0A084IJZ0_SALHC|nr:peptidoglycan DD-metalloendopeptidase family protein [Salinisphaera hydrothermalis]KEZ77024.1 Lipoprotein NlpD [Salinisphaera hydrothermalis C41B8]